MVKYSRLFLPYCLAFWAVFYAVAFLLPVWGVDGFALRVGQTLFQDVWQSGTDDGLFLRFHFAVLSV